MSGGGGGMSGMGMMNMGMSSSGGGMMMGMSALKILFGSTMPRLAIPIDDLAVP